MSKCLAGRECNAFNEASVRDAAKSFGVDPKGGLWKLPARYVGPYAEADARLPLEIYAKQEKVLKEQGLWDIFELESRLLNVTLDMRFKGVRIDIDKAEILNEDCLSKEAKLLTSIRDECGHVVECWSADDLSKAFDKLNI